MIRKQNAKVPNGAVKLATLEKILIQKSRVMTMLILFFDSKGVIHHKYVQEGQTVNAVFYVQVLDY